MKKQLIWVALWMMALAWPSARAEFHILHCQECGNVLMGAARLELYSIYWTGNALSLSVSANQGFGLAGEVNYRTDTVLPNRWNYDTASTYTIGNVAGTTPAIGLYFSPERAGPNPAIIRYFSQTGADLPLSKEVGVTGLGVADAEQAPALVLYAELAAGMSQSGVVAQGESIWLPEGGYAVFKITPALHSARVPAGVLPIHHAIVDLFAVEENTQCESKSQSFLGQPGTQNHFGNGEFHYLYEVGRNITPNGCRYQVSFLATVGQPFEFQARNRRSTATGRVAYTFAIRGHIDFNNLSRWRDSHQTFYLATHPANNRQGPYAHFDHLNPGANETLSAAQSHSLTGIRNFWWDSEQDGLVINDAYAQDIIAQAPAPGVYPLRLRMWDVYGNRLSTEDSYANPGTHSQNVYLSRLLPELGATQLLHLDALGNPTSLETRGMGIRGGMKKSGQPVVAPYDLKENEEIEIVTAADAQSLTPEWLGQRARRLVVAGYQPPFTAQMMFYAQTAQPGGVAWQPWNQTIAALPSAGEFTLPATFTQPVYRGGLMRGEYLIFTGYQPIDSTGRGVGPLVFNGEKPIHFKVK